MQQLIDQVKEIIKNKEVDVVIGWGKGSLPFSATPVFIEKEEDAEKLIFDETCRNNLTSYLTKDKRRLSKRPGFFDRASLTISLRIPTPHGA